MTQVRIKDAAILLGVSDDTMRRWVDTGKIAASNDEAGRKVVDGAELAELAQTQAKSTDPDYEDSISARNHFRGLVTKVTSDKVMSQVEMQCGPYRIVSLISTESVNTLGLQPGVVATARVKATNVVIDLL